MLEWDLVRVEDGVSPIAETKEAGSSVKRPATPVSTNLRTSPPGVASFTVYTRTGTSAVDRPTARAGACSASAPSDRINPSAGRSIGPSTRAPVAKAGSAAATLATIA